MPILTILNASFCNDKEILKKIRDSYDYPLKDDSDLIAAASKISGMSRRKFENTLNGEQSLFNRFSHEKEKAICALKLVLGDLINNRDIIFSGRTAQMLPRRIAHLLTVCITANISYRITQAGKQKISEREARREIEKHDTQLSAWMIEIRDEKDPWNPKLYDMLLPADKVSADEIVKMIKEAEQILKPSPSSLQSCADFQLAAKVEWELINKGHFVDVFADNAHITLTINKNVLMLSKLEEELKELTSAIEGVQSVETKVGKDFHQADLYMSYDFEMPDKVLLVDDERDFVQTLSERLLMRDMGSVVAYDGESALEIIDKEEPEVIILDLRMPKINGIEVLKQIKASDKKIEVIILTGHGSETDRKTCMELGAFAYLQKPVNIDLLSKTMKDAYKKLKEEL